jgi:insertion element IS1 protein InsB
VEVEIRSGLEASSEVEMDEQWSYVGAKDNQRWLWYALERMTGVVLAFVFGRRTDETFKVLLGKLGHFKIDRYYTDDWKSYSKYLPAHKHVISKRYTQRIENKHLTLRTRIKRLARKTICFSKSEELHDGVIGMFINKHCFQPL